MSAAPQSPGYTPAPARKGNGPAYDPFTLPARTDDGSRFMLPVTPAGWSPTNGAAGVLAGHANDLARRLRGKQPRLDAPTVTVALKYVRKVRGEYVLEDRGQATGVQTYESTRPGKVWRKLDGAALWDSFMLGEQEGAYGRAPDPEVWEAARALCEAHGLSGRPLRDVLDWTAVAVCLRAGLVVRPHELPNLGGGR